MPSIAAIERALTTTQTAIRGLHEQKLAVLRRMLIVCQKCRRKSRFSAWAFIQDMYYVEPFSCSGGDYWLHSKTRSCHIVCPKCQFENYIHNHPDREKIVELIETKLPPHSLKDIFASVTERCNR